MELHKKTIGDILLEKHKHIKDIVVTKHGSFLEMDELMFKQMVDQAFPGKFLSANYFQQVNPRYILLAEERTDKETEYVGAIVVEEIIGKINYLDKMIVAKKYQQNGLGKTLWNILEQESKKFIWRASKENPINNFYEKQSDGKVKVKDWNLYWKGLKIGDLKQAIEYALDKPKTMIKTG